MDLAFTLLTAGMIVALTIILVVSALQSHTYRGLLVELTGLLAFAALLNICFGFPVPRDGMTPKGSRNDIVIASVLFGCMVTGMIAHFFYVHFALPRSKRVRTKFDWGGLVAPMFASPIVFIPLLAAFQNADIDLTQLSIPRMMIFFLAFQNGFFWKQYFEQRAQATQKEKELGYDVTSKPK
jgi:hypothetical protein